MTHDHATIYLADQRGCSQTEEYRSFHTFNYGTYFNENRKSFGSLRAINDDTLKPCCSSDWEAIENTSITVLPLVGKLVCTDPDGFIHLVDAGEVLTLFVPQGNTFTITNPYTKELINYLHIWTACDTGLPAVKSILDVSKLNSIVNVVERKDDRIRIAKAEGRKDLVSAIRNTEKGIFIYVIEGAFEVQGRLLDARDALALQQADAVEFEALSTEAILLLIEG